MKIYFLTHKQFFRVIVAGITILTALVIIMGLLYRNLAVPATEVSPIYQGSAEKRLISFAVNVDWGEEYIPGMINIFNKNQIKCTFFLTGRWSEKFPEIARFICQNGQEIGNHGYKHDSPNNMSLEMVKTDIKRTEQIIKQITGKQTLLYAPPSGERKDHVIKAAHEAGYITVLWSIDTIDWKRPAPNRIIEKILGKAHNGAIILMHPTEPTINALPVVIPELKRQGYKIVPVSENILETDREIN